MISATREMMSIPNAKSASYVTISESPVRMKSHRHQLLSSEFERSKEILFLSSKSERSNRHRFVVFLRDFLSRESPFYILRKKSGFVKKKRRDLRETAGDRWSPLQENRNGETTAARTGYCVINAPFNGLHERRSYAVEIICRGDYWSPVFRFFRGGNHKAEPYLRATGGRPYKGGGIRGAAVYRERFGHGETGFCAAVSGRSGFTREVS